MWSRNFISFEAKDRVDYGEARSVKTAGAGPVFVRRRKGGRLPGKGHCRPSGTVSGDLLRSPLVD